MRRRTMIVSLTTAAAGALAGCTAQPTAEPPLPDGMPQPSASPSPTPSAALTPNAPSGTSPFASTRRSTLAPRTPVPVSVPPSTDFEVGVRTLDYARGADRPLPV